MNTLNIDRRRALVLTGLAAFGAARTASAQPADPPAAHDGHAEHPAQTPRLPPDLTTQHTLELPGRTLHFSATAGAIRATGAQDKPIADVAFIAYQLDGTDRVRRPVTFVFNGGPGFASAWLQVGAVGPWRIPLVPPAPSNMPLPAPNPDTWLDFTDLVFMDPAGTGYSRALGSDEAKRKMWTVDGDIDYLAQTIRRWLDRFDRVVSPKYILGESYGGFRAPRLARELASEEGTGVTGLVLLSPALQIPQYNRAFDPFYFVDRLPSMTAAARAARGSVTRAQLADVEHYAATEFLVDVTRGESDPSAIQRRSAQVAAFTGLDPALVRRHHGLLTNDVFLHAIEGGDERVASGYDATLSELNPFPLEKLSNAPDAILEGLKAPVSSAMMAIYKAQLQWRPDAMYRLWNPAVNRQWDWGHSPPQAMSALRNALAVDPHLKVLIAHGIFDLVTPYFGTQLLLDQVPASLTAGRLVFSVFAGGHMIYTNDASRAAFRGEAVRMYD